MSFLKTLLWIVVAVVVALFCFNNWTPASINLWDGMILETKLPLLLGLFFLLGLLPPLLLWQATRYRLKRRVPSEPVATFVSPPAAKTERPPPAGPISTFPPGGA